MAPVRSNSSEGTAVRTAFQPRQGPRRPKTNGVTKARFKSSRTGSANCNQAKVGQPKKKVRRESSPTTESSEDELHTSRRSTRLSVVGPLQPQLLNISGSFEQTPTPTISRLTSSIRSSPLIYTRTPTGEPFNYTPLLPANSNAIPEALDDIAQQEGRQADASERQVDASERQADALERQTDASKRQADASERQVDILEMIAMTLKGVLTTMGVIK